VGQQLDWAAVGRSSKGAVAIASGMANPPGHGGAIVPAAARMAMCGRETWARTGRSRVQASRRRVEATSEPKPSRRDAMLKGAK
jgi:hypothetical protein